MISIVEGPHESLSNGESWGQEVRFTISNSGQMGQEPGSATRHLSVPFPVVATNSALANQQLLLAFRLCILPRGLYLRPYSYHARRSRDSGRASEPFSSSFLVHPLHPNSETLHTSR
jgi:hypothetical protein